VLSVVVLLLAAEHPVTIVAVGRLPVRKVAWAEPSLVLALGRAVHDPLERAAYFPVEYLGFVSMVVGLDSLAKIAHLFGQRRLLIGVE